MRPVSTLLCEYTQLVAANERTPFNISSSNLRFNAFRDSCSNRCHGDEVCTQKLEAAPEQVEACGGCLHCGFASRFMAVRCAFRSIAGA